MIWLTITNKIKIIQRRFKKIYKYEHEKFRIIRKIRDAQAQICIRSNFHKYMLAKQRINIEKDVDYHKLQLCFAVSFVGEHLQQNLLYQLIKMIYDSASSSFRESAYYSRQPLQPEQLVFRQTNYKFMQGSRNGQDQFKQILVATSKDHKNLACTQTPYTWLVQINNKELSSLFFFLLCQIGQFTYDKENRQQTSAFKYGQSIEKQLSVSERQMVNLLMTQNLAPFSLIEKFDPKCKFVICTPKFVVEQAAAITIQGIARRKKAQKEINYNFSDSTLIVGSFKQLSKFGKAARVIQRHAIGRKHAHQSLIFQRMKLAFQSALKNQYFIIKKSTYEKLLLQILKPAAILKEYHSNLTEPVTQAEGKNLFISNSATDNSDLVYKETYWNISPLKRQYLLVNTENSMLYANFSSKLYSTHNMVNEGYVEIKAEYLSPPLNSLLLQQWSDSQHSVNIVACKIKSNTKGKADNDGIAVAGLSCLSGLSGPGSKNPNMDKLMQDLKFEPVIEKINYKALQQNLVADTKVEEFVFNEIPRVMRKSAKFLYRSEYVKISSLPTSNQLDIATKALVFDLTFCDLKGAILSGPYQAKRAQVQIIDSPSLSAEGLKYHCAIYIIKKHVKQLKVRQQVKEKMTKITTLVSKVNELATAGQPKTILHPLDPVATSVQRETASMNLLSLVKKKADKQVVQEERVKQPINVKQPEIRQMSKVQVMREQRNFLDKQFFYDRIVQTSVSQCKKERMAEHNKLIHDAVQQQIQKLPTVRKANVKIRNLISAFKPQQTPVKQKPLKTTVIKCQNSVEYKKEDNKPIRADKPVLPASQKFGTKVMQDFGQSLRSSSEGIRSSFCQLGENRLIQEQLQKRQLTIEQIKDRENAVKSRRK
ncbi:Leucine-rich_repeat-containing protein [Hexamita inflata]|uniref:Leucine-rich repeat-containing protein n=1 Tax=Hexamita inflata TaxID=28002 RepID=A0AA86PZ20_9EUKA|nr:Leucine-rich repeat-containing protein [Hexamita inflata]